MYICCTLYNNALTKNAKYYIQVQNVIFRKKACEFLQTVQILDIFLSVSRADAEAERHMC